MPPPKARAAAPQAPPAPKFTMPTPEALGVTVPQSGYVRVWIVLAYLWLPYMVLPVFAGFGRVPESLLEASADLGAPISTTLRRVVAPLVLLCRSERLMGELRIGRRTLFVGAAIAVAITCVDATTVWGVLPF